MKKIIFLSIILSCFAFSYDINNIQSILTSGININHTTKGKTKNILIKREINPKCKAIYIENDVFWEENYANNEIDDSCKSTFITSAGRTISPMKIHKDIETFGELEVLYFIKKMKNDNNLLLIDTREEDWYNFKTIPGAINIHYVFITKPSIFDVEFKSSLNKFGVFGYKKPFDFSKAKTLLLFCNGAWCSQSTRMAKHLILLGYPPKKIKWYRGGMQSWLSLSMTSTMKIEN